ncbi:MAG: hypothetical protein U0S48_13655 [Solirubrobacteraceae bacterium]
MVIRARSPATHVSHHHSENDMRKRGRSAMSFKTRQAALKRINIKKKHGLVLKNKHQDRDARNAAVELREV